LESDEVMAAMSVTVLIRFQLASTAFTVTLNAVPEVCAIGLPLLPDGDPGAAVSPGRSSCNLVKVPEMTGIAGLRLAALVPSMMSVALIVAVPAVLRTTLKIWVPATKPALDGSTEFAS